MSIILWELGYHPEHVLIVLGGRPYQCDMYADKSLYQVTRTDHNLIDCPCFRVRKSSKHIYIHIVSPASGLRALRLFVRISDNIKSIKIMLTNSYGCYVSVDSMYLTYEGKILHDDDATIEECNIANNARIYCSFRLLGGARGDADTTTATTTTQSTGDHHDNASPIDLDEDLERDDDDDFAPHCLEHEDGMRQSSKEIIGIIRRATFPRSPAASSQPAPSPPVSVGVEHECSNDGEEEDPLCGIDGDENDEDYDVEDICLPCVTPRPAARGRKEICAARSFSNTSEKSEIACRCDLKGRFRYIGDDGGVKTLNGCCPSCNAAGCGCKECGIDVGELGAAAFEPLRKFRESNLRLKKKERHEQLKNAMVHYCIADSTSERWKWNWRVQCDDEKIGLPYFSTCIRGFARAFGLSHNTVDSCKNEIKLNLRAGKSSEYVDDRSVASKCMLKKMAVEARPIYAIAMSADLESLAQLPNAEWTKEAYAWIKMFVELVSTTKNVG